MSILSAAGTRNDIRQVGKKGRLLPSTREVSTSIHTLSTERDFSPTLTVMHMLWGQFIDHDITHTPLVSMVSGKINKYLVLMTGSNILLIVRKY